MEHARRRVLLVNMGVRGQQQKVSDTWAAADAQESNPKEEKNADHCNSTDKRHTAYNGKAALYKLRTVSHSQQPETLKGTMSRYYKVGPRQNP